MRTVIQIGTERMTLGLEWTRQEAFRNQSLVPWLVDRDVAGVTRNGGGLTFATIGGAGHFVRVFQTFRCGTSLLNYHTMQAPLDRPVQSLELAKRWFEGTSL